MKLTTFLAAFTGLDLVTASPVPTDVVAHPSWALLKPRATVSWKYADVFKDEPERKRDWEQRCEAVLNENGCGSGVIQGREYPSTYAKGAKIPYVKILGTLDDPNSQTEKTRRFRVYRDGSSRDGWRWDPKKEADGPKEQPLLFWNNVNVYEGDPRQKEEWEQRCVGALTHCQVVMIHGPETLVKEGKEMPYVDVIGAPLTDMEYTRKVRVFEDGTFQHGRTRRTQPRKSDSETKTPGDHRVLISWASSSGRSYGGRSKRKIDWEEKCQEPLLSRGCGFGIIHKAETRVTKNQGKTTYVNVEGAPSPGMKPTERMRVFYDGSSEDGWTMRDKYLTDQPAQKRRKIMGLEDQEDTGNPKHKVSWDPPDAYRSRPILRDSYEDACRIALAREKCDFGIIHQGHHSYVDSTHGTREGSLFMKVSAGMNENPENTRLMKLYESGLSEWYHPKGPEARKERRKWYNGKQIIPPAYQRPSGPKAKWDKIRTRAPIRAPPPDPQTPPQGSQPPPQALTGLFHSTSGGQHHYTASPAHGPYLAPHADFFHPELFHPELFQAQIFHTSSESEHPYTAPRAHGPNSGPYSGLF